MNEKDLNFPPSRKIIRIGVGPALLILCALGLAIVGVGAFYLYSKSVQSRIDQASNKAARELDLVTPMPGSTFVRRGQVRKGDHGSVTDHYRSPSNYEQIKSYYDAEFERRGWTRLGDRKVLVWGKDVGAAEVAYCKNGEQADVYFVGNQQTPEDITYTIGTTWRTGCRGHFSP